MSDHRLASGKDPIIIDADVDPRDWQPHVPGDPTFLPLLHRIRARVSIPTAALVCEGDSPCDFHFGLRLPDMRMDKAATEGPGSGASYCIRLANAGVPWVGCTNVLAGVEVRM